MAGEAVIPIFPLGVVLLPLMRLPLHIFEERYKLMIGMCLEQQSEFGVVHQDEGRLEDVGCRASVRKVLRRYPDGRLDILTVGGSRFRILDVRRDKPYLEAAVDPFVDDAPAPDALSDELPGRATALLVQLSGMIGRPADLTGLRRLSAEELSFTVAAVAGFPLKERQWMLESNSTAERLERGVRGLEQTLERLRRTIEARRLGGGNGHAKGAFGGR